MSDHLLEKLEDFLPLLISGLLIFAVGIILTKLIIRIMTKAFNRSKLDETACSFLLSLVQTILYVLVIIIALSKMDVPMTSIIATLSAAGLAIGLALQDSLSNVAGGFIIMFSHPFRVGDFIEVGSTSGTVSNITILYTHLLTIDNKAVMIPNGTVSSSTIINYTQEDKRRLDIPFGIEYAADFREAEQLILSIIENEPLALKDPAPAAVMTEHGASAVIITAQVWVKPSDYWALNYKLLADVKEAFDENDIEIPYNHLDVNINGGCG